MLLSFPAAILIVIFAIVIILGTIFVIFVGVFNAKQSEEIRSEPERIKKKSDSPELPHEGQEEKPIDKVDKKVEKE